MKEVGRIEWLIRLLIGNGTGGVEGSPLAQHLLFQHLFIPSGRAPRLEKPFSRTPAEREEDEEGRG